MPLQNLFQLLNFAATNYPAKGIIVYFPGDVQKIGERLSYPDLLEQAKQRACMLQHQIRDLKANSIVLLHFDHHIDSILWYWATVIAGYVPAISTPFSNDLEQRKMHLRHLREMLHDPICITRKRLLSEFAVVDAINVRTVEDLQYPPPTLPYERNISDRVACKQVDDIATLMLTSGSTGNAKAVGLRHGQILQAVSGKSKFNGTTAEDVFLNWIGMDHVANLTEIHLHAMFLGADQVHVQAADLLLNPRAFVDLLSLHRVTFTFAPNFFLASLERSYTQSEVAHTSKPDLSSLRCLVSGGEANPVETCTALIKILRPFGVPANVIRPAFGMTETCAGSVYGLDFPGHDVSQGYEFASVGSSIPGMDIRITGAEGEILGNNETGNLEVAGPVVFRDYYNNHTATAEAKTSDGWFRTGDRAFIDSCGQLSLAGRAKETIRMNGITYYPHELEAAIGEAAIPGISPGNTLVFASRCKGSPTEEICVVYSPSYDSEDVKSRVATAEEITRVIVLSTGARPLAIVPLGDKILQKSTLGKLPRSKISAAFVRGDYVGCQALNDRVIEEYRRQSYQRPQEGMESAIADAIAHLFNIPPTIIGANTNFLEFDISSIELIKLKQYLRKKLELQNDILVITLISNPTVKELAVALQEAQKTSTTYDPVVTLQKHGDKTPLWLVHPGVGEILVFLPLGKYILERPVYALRARGFGPDEPYFKDINEVVTTYHQAIKHHQPRGPYAIAGYSYGAMLAFEITKVLESTGDEVRFLGSFNLPPHIKFRMRQLDWTEVLLNLSYFLGLLSEDHAHAISVELHGLPREKFVSRVVRDAAPIRMKELDLDAAGIEKWVGLAHQLQAMARDYDPSGTVASIDVFCATPLKAVAKTREDWVANHLDKWKDFSTTEPRLHHVQGSHYTMISPENVFSFQKLFKKALNARGL